MSIKLKNLIYEVLQEDELKIKSLVSQYLKDTEYDVEHSLGNCSFFTKDVMNWAKRKGIKADYVYMPQSEEYRRKNKIGKDFGGNDDDWEDHIVPMIDNYIIDFTMTDKGVSKHIRTRNTIPPVINPYNEALFSPNGLYGKYGYTNAEINTTYGNHKDINSFNVVAPKKNNK
jgi:hypothetical protein